MRQTGENDLYDMSISPMNIYEIQVLPIGIHNLSNSFRPNLTTFRRMNNKVYITETKPSASERNARFKLKSYSEADIQYE